MTDCSQLCHVLKNKEIKIRGKKTRHYGLAAWGQASKSHLQKILGLQKRVLRLMYFSEPRAHAVPLFTSSKILPLNMLYVETVSTIMFDVSCLRPGSNVEFHMCRT